MGKNQKENNYVLGNARKLSGLGIKPLSDIRRVLNDKLLKFLDLPTSKAGKKALIDLKGQKGVTSKVQICHPVFYKEAIALSGGNFSLLKATAITGKSNACSVCSNATSSLNRRCCSKTCSDLDTRRKEKFKNTCLSRYGVTAPMKSSKVVAKYNSNYKAKTGYNWPLSSPEAHAKAGKTSVSKYGFIRGSMSAEVKAASRETCLKRYGVPFATQNPDVQDRIRKARFKDKIFVEPSGKVHSFLQGYEPAVLKWLTDRGVTNVLSKVTEVPRIPYGNGKYYFPDAYFISPDGKKYLLEVKSTYTLTCDWAKNLQKFKAANLWCKNNGCTFLLSVSEKNDSSCLSFCKNPTPEKIRNLLKSKFGYN